MEPVFKQALFRCNKKIVFTRFSLGDITKKYSHKQGKYIYSQIKEGWGLMALAQNITVIPAKK